MYIFIGLLILYIYIYRINPYNSQIKGVSHYKYFQQVAENILILKRFSIKLTSILEVNPLTIRQLA